MLGTEQVKLPLFDQDLEATPSLIAQVAVLHARISLCDGLVVASPEYNGQMTPYLKNVVDWVSRMAHINSRFENPFLDRPVFLCSASTGWSGGAVAIPQVRALFGYVGALALGGAVCVPYAEQAWTDFGYMFDPAIENQISESSHHFLKLSNSFNQSRGIRSSKN